MAINLSKGQKVDLTKTNPGLTNVVVGLGWDVNKYDGGNDFDLDSSVFLLNGAGKCASESDFIFTTIRRVQTERLNILEITVQA